MSDVEHVALRVLDLGLLERSMVEVQKTLDHKLLNRVEALGPPTLENLSRFIFERVQHAIRGNLSMGSSSRPAAREGQALIAGLLRCRRCSATSGFGSPSRCRAA